jgi:hypothetical protein
MNFKIETESSHTTVTFQYLAQWQIGLFSFVLNLIVVYWWTMSGILLNRVALILVW